MSSLRSDAIQAIADAILHNMRAPLADVYIPEGVDIIARHTAKEALDALLDYLEAHTEEWEDAGDDEPGGHIDGLIVALRRVEP